MKDTLKDKLYLAALLHHIDSLKEEFKELNNSDIQKYLNKADQYATASSHFEEGNLERVASPFETLKRSKGGNQRDFSYGYQVLNLGSRFFPSITPQDEKSIAELWKAFKEDYKSLTQSGKAKAETTLHLLHKYAVTIPNPSKIHPEVSFYDYAKIKAGLAVCLYDVAQAPDDRNQDAPLLIIRADISGIQEFIGSIASKNASKNLKGRSFYVQLLVDTVLKLMLKKLNLYEGNVMYASGGNFFVIAPNTVFVRDAFEQFEKDITKAIFAEHKTRIAVVMGCQEVTEQQVLDGKIDEAIVDLFEKVIDKKKKQKFKSIIKKDYNQFFEPSDVGGEVAMDAITGEEIIESKNNIYYLEGALPEKATAKQIKDGLNLIRKTTAKQIFLGYYLKDIQFLVTTEEELSPSLKKQDKYIASPANLGLNFYTITNNIKTAFDNVLQLTDDYTISTINTKSKSSTVNLVISKQKNVIPSFMLYGGNKAPVFEIDGYKEEVYNNKTRKLEPISYKKEQLKDFSHLTLNFLKDKDGNFLKNKKGEPIIGDFKRLGVLKMDVDGLGSIFKDFIPYPKYKDKNDKGVRRPFLTFSYYSALSRNLDWFFKGYLNNIWKENDNLKYSTQIIYSGGDDLFIVGRWDAVIEFSEKIKTSFQTFSCADNLTTEEIKQNAVTISGGISIVTHKFPIMKASVFAGDAEHAAKRHELLKEDVETPRSIEDYHFTKNSISIFGEALHWER